MQTFIRGHKYFDDAATSQLAYPVDRNEVVSLQLRGDDCNALFSNPSTSTHQPQSDNLSLILSWLRMSEIAHIIGSAERSSLGMRM